MAKPNEYHLLDLAGKQRVWRARQWSPPTTRCSTCRIVVVRDQLGAHERSRCAGEPLVRR